MTEKEKALEYIRTFKEDYETLKEDAVFIRFWGRVLKSLLWIPYRLESPEAVAVHNAISTLMAQLGHTTNINTELEEFGIRKGV